MSVTGQFSVIMMPAVVFDSEICQITTEWVDPSPSHPSHPIHRPPPPTPPHQYYCTQAGVLCMHPLCQPKFPVLLLYQAYTTGAETAMITLGRCGWVIVHLVITLTWQALLPLDKAHFQCCFAACLTSVFSIFAVPYDSGQP